MNECLNDELRYILYNLNLRACSDTFKYENKYPPPKFDILMNKFVSAPRAITSYHPIPFPNTFRYTFATTNNIDTRYSIRKKLRAQTTLTSTKLTNKKCTLRGNKKKSLWLPTNREIVWKQNQDIFRLGGDPIGGFLLDKRSLLRQTGETAPGMDRQ